MSEPNDKPCVIFSDERCCQTCKFWMKPPIDYRPGACAGLYGAVKMPSEIHIGFYESRYFYDCCQGWTDDMEVVKRCL